MIGTGEPRAAMDKARTVAHIVRIAQATAAQIEAGRAGPADQAAE